MIDQSSTAQLLPAEAGKAAPATRLAATIRAASIDMIGAAGFGFLGSCMSVADILAALAIGWRLPCPALCRDDVVLLSKGHAAPALYALAHGSDWRAQGEYAAYGSALQGHPRRLSFSDTPSTTGSLGLGIGHAIGVWLGRRAAGANPRLAIIVGDGEMQAGATLEALAFTRRIATRGTLFVVDANQYQSTGQVPAAAALGEQLRAVVDTFVEVDGHDLDVLTQCFASVRPDSPSLGVLARTSRSAGVAELDLAERPMSTMPDATALHATAARLWAVAGAR